MFFRQRRTGRITLWLLLSLALTFAWWNLSPRLIHVGSMPMGLGLRQGVPIAVNLALAWAFGLLGARTSGPATVGIVMTSIALPYLLLAALLILGRIFG